MSKKILISILTMTTLFVVGCANNIDNKDKQSLLDVNTPEIYVSKIQEYLDNLDDAGEIEFGTFEHAKEYLNKGIENIKILKQKVSDDVLSECFDKLLELYENEKNFYKHLFVEKENISNETKYETKLQFIDDLSLSLKSDIKSLIDSYI